MTITGYKNRILETVPTIKPSKAERLAYKIAKRAERMQAEFDFFESLRILGIINDPTPLEAIGNMEDVA